MYFNKNSQKTLKNKYFSLVLYKILFIVDMKLLIEIIKICVSN